MTICVAAIAGRGEFLCGAADRRITLDGGWMEYDPARSKIYQLTESIVAMIAGDTPSNVEIIERMRREMADLYGPDDQPTVSALTNLYASEYRAFIEEQGPARTAAGLASAVEIGTIIAGLDACGLRLYSVLNGVVSNDGHEGYSAIGIGASHAAARLASVPGYRNLDRSNALMNVYIAKRRAEAASHVGAPTDVFFLTSAGKVCVLDDAELRILERYYQAYRVDLEAVEEAHRAKFADLFEDLWHEVERPRLEAEAQREYEREEREARERKEPDPDA